MNGIKFNMILKKLYNKILLISAKPKAEVFLGTIAFTESSFFSHSSRFASLTYGLSKAVKVVETSYNYYFFFSAWRNIWLFYWCVFVGYNRSIDH